MKFKLIKITGLALLSAISLSACKPDMEESLPIVTFLVSESVKAAGSGNCAISINATGLYSGTVLQLAVLGAADTSGTFRTQYNTVYPSAQVSTQAELQAAPFNLKYDAFFTTNTVWTAAVRASYINTVATAMDAGSFATAGVSATTAAGLKAIRGTAILTCARIPRSSCAIGSLTTATLAADIVAQTAAVNVVLSTAEARKTPAYVNAVKSTGFSGLATTSTATLFDGSFTPASGGSATSFTGNNILASNAYPKFGTLVTLGFGNLMPVTTGTTAYALDASTFTQGSNIAVAQVTSCESIGLSDRGFTQTASASSVPLTPAKEIAYNFSTSGSAAALYATAIGATAGSGTQATEDAIQFNKALRSRFAVPLALQQGGKLDDISAISGNGGATATLTTCLYGQTAAIRTTAAAVLAASSSTLSGINDCPALASTAAARFGDTGNQTLANFPNN